MEIYNVHEAKTHLSRLLELVEAGEEILIARAGKPAARLVPFVKTAAGIWRIQVKIAHDFDETPEELLAGFEGADL
ncbi:MAG: type II toxin-antitoxin system prevent-host-death family antitoxin [Candidatus Sericytochromatia bacterium]|nr:type II toxin-antitoxin system prevent-host-death family antitoxin [Candidatus Sericytochromatia bacterium]